MGDIARGRALLFSVCAVAAAFACWWVLVFARHGLLLAPSAAAPLRILWIPSQVLFLGFPLLATASLLADRSRWAPRSVGMYFLFGSFVAVLGAALTRQALPQFAVTGLSYGYCGAALSLSKDLRAYLGRRRHSPRG
jgi:hypothetical protein